MKVKDCMMLVLLALANLMWPFAKLAYLFKHGETMRSANTRQQAKNFNEALKRAVELAE